MEPGRLSVKPNSDLVFKTGLLSTSIGAQNGHNKGGEVKWCVSQIALLFGDTPADVSMSVAMFCNRSESQAMPITLLLASVETPAIPIFPVHQPPLDHISGVDSDLGLHALV